ncbi:MAG: hypothetical protein ISR64_03300 [Deltaproteobacteria bacterium]|nr:hypothetical protein [Deltaproteobacteria bacterium]
MKLAACRGLVVSTMGILLFTSCLSVVTNDRIEEILLHEETESNAIKDHSLFADWSGDALQIRVSDLCLSRKKTLYERTTFHERTAEGYEDFLIAGSVLTGGAAVLFGVSPLVSNREYDYTKNDGTTSKTNKRVLVYSFGGILAAIGVPLLAAVVAQGVRAIDSKESAQVEQATPWRREDCHTRPLAGRAVQVRYVSDKSIFQPLTIQTDVNGRLDLPDTELRRWLLSDLGHQKPRITVELASRPTAAETKGGAPAVTVALPPTVLARFEKVRRQARAKAVAGAAKAGGRAYRSGQWGALRAAWEDCKSIAPTSATCHDLGYLLTCAQYLDSSGSSYAYERLLELRKPVSKLARSRACVKRGLKKHRAAWARQRREEREQERWETLKEDHPERALALVRKRWSRAVESAYSACTRYCSWVRTKRGKLRRAAARGRNVDFYEAEKQLQAKFEALGIQEKLSLVEELTTEFTDVGGSPYEVRSKLGRLAGPCECR